MRRLFNSVNFERFSNVTRAVIASAVLSGCRGGSHRQKLCAEDHARYSPSKAFSAFPGDARFFFAVKNFFRLTKNKIQFFSCRF